MDLNNGTDHVCAVDFTGCGWEMNGFDHVVVVPRAWDLHCEFHGGSSFVSFIQICFLKTCILHLVILYRNPNKSIPLHKNV